jgi:hypothetical protein
MGVPFPTDWQPPDCVSHLSFFAGALGDVVGQPLDRTAGRPPDGRRGGAVWPAAGRGRSRRLPLWRQLASSGLGGSPRDLALASPPIG